MNKNVNVLKLEKEANLFLLVILLFFLTALLMLPSNPIDSLPGRDNGVFLYGGQQVLLGKVPYLDFWDHKGPLIYYINALGLWIGSGSRWGVWGTEFIFLALTSLGIYQVAKAYWGQVAGLISLAGWGYGIVAAGSYYHFHDSNYTETYSLLFNVFSVYFWTRALPSQNKSWYYILIGVMGGCSFMLRPNNIGPQLAIVMIEVFSMIRSRSFVEGSKRIGKLALGGLATIVAFVLFFTWKNALPEFIDSVIGYNLVYRRSGTSSFLDIVRGGLSLLNWIPLIAYLVMLVRFSWGLSKKKDDFFSSMFVSFLLIGWPIELLLTSLSGRILLHYYITWIPYMAWLVGGAFSVIFASLMKKVESIPVSFLFMPLLVLLFASNVPALNKYMDVINHLISNRGSGIEKQSAIVNYVVDRTKPVDYVLVWGNDLWINFSAQRMSPTRYAYQYPLFMPGYTDAGKVAQFLQDLQDTRPALIVEPVVDTSEILPLNIQYREKLISEAGLPDGMEAVFKFIDQNYCVVAILHDITIYQFKTESSQGSKCQ